MHALPNGAVDTCGAGRKRPPGASKVPLNTRPDKHPLLHPLLRAFNPAFLHHGPKPSDRFPPLRPQREFRGLGVRAQLLQELRAGGCGGGRGVGQASPAPEEKENQRTEWRPALSEGTCCWTTACPCRHLAAWMGASSMQHQSIAAAKCQEPPLFPPAHMLMRHLSSNPSLSPPNHLTCLHEKLYQLCGLHVRQVLVGDEESHVIARHRHSPDDAHVFSPAAPGSNGWGWDAPRAEPRC